MGLAHIIDRTLSSLERRCAKLQGKGWGAASVRQEVARAASLMGQKEAKLCIDIGGNKGSYADALTVRFPQSEIIIFEPAAVNVEILTARFGGKRHITIEPYALSNSAGLSQLHSDEAGSGLGSLTKRDLSHMDLVFETSESVETCVFSDYWQNRLGKRPIDLCKLDVEGHELDALQGFGSALKAIDVIQFEFGGANIDTKTYFRDFWHFFGDHGFQLYRISPFCTTPIKRYHERHEAFVTTNFLAKRL